MPLTNFPVPGADLFNAGNMLRDRGRYSRSGAFAWFPSGSHAFTGVLVGYAPNAYQGTATAGSYGIDGGAAHPVYGMGAVAVDRWCASSLQVNGGTAWGVHYPSVGMNLPSSYELSRALDRMHKDGSVGTTVYTFNHGPSAGGGSPPVSIGNLLAFGTASILLHAGLRATNEASPAIDPYERFSWLLDFVFDGVGRFTIGIHDGAARFDHMWGGVTGSFGFIPSGSMSVGMRYALGGSDSIHLDAGATWLTGA